MNPKTSVAIEAIAKDYSYEGTMAWELLGENIKRIHRAKAREILLICKRVDMVFIDQEYVGHVCAYEEIEL